MVGPSISDEDRERFLLQLRVGFAIFVGFSMGLVVYYSDGGLVALGGAILAGIVVGTALAWWIFPDSMGKNPYDR